MAPAREPGLFRCAFGYVGLYDSEIQFDKSDTGESESGIRYLKRAFGNSEAEQHAMSPINHVDKLKLPIALAAGARDPRCPPEHTEAMRRASAACRYWRKEKSQKVTAKTQRRKDAKNAKEAEKGEPSFLGFPFVALLCALCVFAVTS